MSIWSSAQPGVMAFDLSARDGYRPPEGGATVNVDIATAASFHDLIRLAIWDDDGIDVSLLLTPQMAGQLRDNLGAALGNR